MSKTVGFRIAQSLYNQIVAALPAYGKGNDIFSWMSAEYTDTLSHIANPTAEAKYAFVFPAAVPPGTLPLISFAANMFPNPIF